MPRMKAGPAREFEALHRRRLESGIVYARVGLVPLTQVNVWERLARVHSGGRAERERHDRRMHIDSKGYASLHSVARQNRMQALIGLSSYLFATTGGRHLQSVVPHHLVHVGRNAEFCFDCQASRRLTHDGIAAASLGVPFGLLLIGSEAAAAGVTSASSANWSNYLYGFLGFLPVLILLKTNLVDFNGPLAGVVGMKTATCIISTIFVDSEVRAGELLQRLTSGASPPTQEEFIDMAREAHPAGTSRFFTRTIYQGVGTTEPEIEAIIFNTGTAVGVPHGPIKTKIGYYIVWIVERDLA